MGLSDMPWFEGVRIFYRMHSARPDARLHARPGTPARPVLLPEVHQFEEALLFVPQSIASGNPLLVFFHGAGGAASSSLRLVQTAAAEHGCLVLLPNSAARTWDFIAGGWGPDVDRLDVALAAAFDHFAVSDVAFGGFSDGASYALSIGLANGGLATTLLAFSPGFAAPPGRIGQPRVWISHGTEDAVLPIDRCARPVARALGKAGYDLHYEEFTGPHTVPPDSVDRALRWWLAGPDS
jgi:phospholipase/carboxylesterase